MGAVSSWTSTPASDGPATYATARLVERRPFAASTCSRGTVAVKNELYERSKKTAHEPTRKTTTNSCSSDSASNAAASGIDASSAARSDVGHDHDAALDLPRVDPDADRQREQRGAAARRAP